MADEIRGYPATGSTIDRRIRTGLSPFILVRVGGEAVGAIQSLTANEQRGVVRVQELGTDGVIELTPNAPAQVSLQVQRLVFDNLRLPPAFKRGFAHIQAQRLPFDVAVYDRTHGSCSNIGNQVIIYRNCYFESYSTTYASNNYQITENATIAAQYVENLLPETADSNERGLQPDMHRIENEANLGIRLGTLDYPDLIDEFWTGSTGPGDTPPTRLRASLRTRTTSRSVACQHGNRNFE